MALSTSAIPVPAEGHVVSEAEESPVMGQEGDRPGASTAVQLQEEDQGYSWPAVSSARMRAGLRSALKTESSGFKFQNGGRNLRWLRQHTADEAERSRLFWQGHMCLFEQHWSAVKPTHIVSLWSELTDLDRAYRERCSPHSGDRSHLQAMLADGTVERAMWWALDPRSGLQYMIFESDECRGRSVLLALALQGVWTWLLGRWQTAVVTCWGQHRWRAMIAEAAIQTGSLALVHKHITFADPVYSLSPHMWFAVGYSGSLQMFDFLTRQGFLRRTNNMLIPMMHAASEHGHQAFMEGVLTRVPSAKSRFEATYTTLLGAASKGGQLHVVEWLLSQGAVPDTGVLHHAVKNGQYAIVSYLHEHARIELCPEFDVVLGKLLIRSPPTCLPILEHLAQHFHYVPTGKHIIDAAIAANMRPDVLHFLTKHASQEEWDGALADRHVGEDLGVQDLLHAAARDAGRLV